MVYFWADSLVVGRSLYEDWRFSDADCCVCKLHLKLIEFRECFCFVHFVVLLFYCNIFIILFCFYNSVSLACCWFTWTCGSTDPMTAMVAVTCSCMSDHMAGVLNQLNFKPVRSEETANNYIVDWERKPQSNEQRVPLCCETRWR